WGWGPGATFAVRPICHVARLDLPKKGGFHYETHLFYFNMEKNIGSLRFPRFRDASQCVVAPTCHSERSEESRPQVPDSSLRSE
ncbi:MAG: hypothetical protein ACPGWR_13445, partial [Ardenticatenaceae bacterium]